MIETLESTVHLKILAFSLWRSFHVEIYWLKEIQSMWETSDHCFVSLPCYMSVERKPVNFLQDVFICHIYSDTFHNLYTNTLGKSAFPSNLMSIQKKPDGIFVFCPYSDYSHFVIVLVERQFIHYYSRLMYCILLLSRSESVLRITERTYFRFMSIRVCFSMINKLFPWTR